MSTPFQNLYFLARPLKRIFMGYLRPLEILALIVVIVAAVGASRLYFDSLSVQKTQMDELQREGDRLHRQIKEIDAKYKQTDRLVSNTEGVLDKLEEFDNRFLKDQLQGRLLLIDELNKLVRKNEVVIKGPISFSPIEDKKSDKNSRTKRKKGDFVNPYPGLEVRFSISGSYENFRKLLYDLETNKLFLIIEQLDLESTADDQLGTRSQPNALASGDALNVKLELKVYFRKQTNAAS